MSIRMTARSGESLALLLRVKNILGNRTGYLRRPARSTLSRLESVYQSFYAFFEPESLVKSEFSSHVSICKCEVKAKYTSEYCVADLEYMTGRFRGLIPSCWIDPTSSNIGETNILHAFFISSRFCKNATSWIILSLSNVKSNRCIKVKEHQRVYTAATSRGNGMTEGFNCKSGKSQSEQEHGDLLVKSLAKQRKQETLYLHTFRLYFAKRVLGRHVEEMRPDFRMMVSAGRCVNFSLLSRSFLNFMKKKTGRPASVHRASAPSFMGETAYQYGPALVTPGSVSRAPFELSFTRIRLRQSAKLGYDQSVFGFTNFYLTSIRVWEHYVGTDVPQATLTHIQCGDIVDPRQRHSNISSGKPKTRGVPPPF
ncbi:hypothetical protein BDN70DRAFT_892433 [Pholiota conissans]|uniref:Uncharacterized protein n=1 Tax=Pholiota conissans TaxID=109636 RepID=A0A9P6D4I1_9AGAR|nr:hypothetical protein BDN70DRAFT_892433 [Pholiota conissans]